MRIRPICGPGQKLKLQLLETQLTESKTPRRRGLLKGLAIATGAMSAPMIAKAQAGPISMRWQSTWPAKDIFHEYALDYAKKVNDMTGGDLKIEVLPAGAVVPAFGLLEAVSKGTLDGGHGVLGYHYGKQNALALWNSGPAFGMDANMILSWHKYGGGAELLAKLYASIGGNVQSFLYGPMSTQPLGWFKKPITKSSDSRLDEILEIRGSFPHCGMRSGSLNEHILKRNLLKRSISCSGLAIERRSQEFLRSNSILILGHIFLSVH